MPITLNDLSAVHDFAASRARVKEVIRRSTADPELLVRFLHLYTDWNGYFGAGVASLAGLIGRARGLFFDPTEPVQAIADRSVLIASYVFDAARDEFNDRQNPARDTHRCLAQALVKGVALHYGIVPASLNQLCTYPMWLLGLNDRVAIGYGVHSQIDLPAIARAMGYHLGSEVLASNEFSEIDHTIRSLTPDLYADLRARTVRINNVDHQCFSWISIHSEHGGGVEMEHFEHGVKAIRLALQFLPENLHIPFTEQVLLGFQDFAHDNRQFFRHVL